MHKFENKQQPTEQKEHEPCSYYPNSGLIPSSIPMDALSNTPAFFGDLFNMITAPFNIRVAMDNHKRRLARRKFKEDIIVDFLYEEEIAYVEGKAYKKLSEIRAWFADKCNEKEIALNIRDINAWEERLQFIQYQAICRDAAIDALTDNDDLSKDERLRGIYNFLEDSLKPIKKKKAIKTQTISSIIKHGIFGIGGILGIGGIAFGLVALSFLFPIAIPLFGAIGFQTISGICTALWGSANGVEYISKLEYAEKKIEKLQKYKEFFNQLPEKSKDKNIERILNKKLRNAELRYETEKRRSSAFNWSILGAAGMCISSVMLAAGTILSSTLVGSPAGVPLMIAGGIIGALGTISYMKGYADSIKADRKENEVKEKNRLADVNKDNSEIAKIIKQDKTLEAHKKELYKVRKKGTKITLGFVSAGIVTAGMVVPLSVLSVFFPPLAPVAIAFTILGTSFLAAGVILGVCTVAKSSKIQNKIMQRECELTNKIVNGDKKIGIKKIPGYENMPAFKSQPKPISRWGKIKARFLKIFSRKKKQQPAQPVQPKRPEQPVQPKRPEQPVQPKRPEQPVQPKRPEQPVQPVKNKVNRKNDLNNTSTKVLKTLVIKEIVPKKSAKLVSKGIDPEKITKIFAERKNATCGSGSLLPSENDFDRYKDLCKFKENSF
jgi:hypothetical protein